MGDWVRYKLDRQVDHVLVDEAQDTNAAQWEIIEQLVEEFFSGSSEAEGRGRTLFMVGDFKQAIYGFQGTDPQRVRASARGSVQAARRRAVSTGDDLLELSAAGARIPRPVDRRELPLGAAGARRRRRGDRRRSDRKRMGLSEPPPPHRAHHRDRPGTVELWQPFAVEESPDDSDEGEERWVALRDRRYADALAERIKRWSTRRRCLPRPGGR